LSKYSKCRPWNPCWQKSEDSLPPRPDFHEHPGVDPDGKTQPSDRLSYDTDRNSAEKPKSEPRKKW
jgi:hypothetical protein